jgi:hypothetical protein
MDKESDLERELEIQGKFNSNLLRSNSHGLLRVNN